MEWAFIIPTVKAQIGADEEAVAKYAERYEAVSVSSGYAEYMKELLLKTDKLQVFNGEIRTGTVNEGEGYFYMETDKELGKAIQRLDDMNN